MEALLAAELPEGPGWQYEPKWDGFRCLARRDGGEVTLTSKSGKPLARYFPETVELLRNTSTANFLVDGELIIMVGGALAFDALQMRLHPAESRIRKLSVQTPAELMLFDILELDGTSLTDLPQSQRRERLQQFVRDNAVPGLHLSPMTCDRQVALTWLERSGGALDGVIAKRADLPYRAGERWAWWLAWFLPAWAAAVPLQFLAFGVAAGEPPAPPMISGPIVAGLAAGVLLLDRRRFVALSVAPSVVPASGSPT